MYKFNRGLASRYTAYIKNNRKAEGSNGSVIPLLLSPNSLSETLTANYDQQNVPGHGSPIISYSYTGARQVSLSYTVSADHVPEGYTMNSYLGALKELEYPTYNASIVYAPSCTLVLPNLSLDGVCTSVTIDYKTERTLQNGSMSAEVSLSFTEVRETLAGYINIELDSSVDNILPGAPSNNKLTQDVVLSDALSIYGEGLEQSSPVNVEYNVKNNKISSYKSYDNSNRADVDTIISKYNVYGNVSNISISTICLDCGLQSSGNDCATVLKNLGNHILEDHNKETCTFKLTYRGTSGSKSELAAKDYRYVKGKINK